MLKITKEVIDIDENIFNINLGDILQVQNKFGITIFIELSTKINNSGGTLLSCSKKIMLFSTISEYWRINKKVDFYIYLIITIS